YAEVVVQYNQKRYFSSIWGSGTLPVRARAVARGLMAPGSLSILVLNKTASPSLSLSGVNLTAADKIIVDSNAAGAVKLGGNSGSIVGSEIDIVGGITGHNNVYAPTIGSTSKVFTNDTKDLTDDPLANLAQPSTSGVVIRSNSSFDASNQVLQPGIYIGGF